MTFKLRWRLTLMMILQYAIWGAWAAVAGKYFSNLGPAHGFTGKTIGFVFSLSPLATMFTPFMAGYLADRHVNAEKLLGILNLIGAAMLYLVAGQVSYATIVPLMFIYALFMAPTVALSNAITFRHIPNPTRDFGSIRVGGTIGWMAAGWILGTWRMISIPNLQGDLFYLASFLSLLMGLFAFTLPATLPEGKGTNPLGFLDALRMFKNRQFVVFILIAFLASTQLDFHYIFTSAYLGAPLKSGGMGFSDAMIPFVLSIAQMSEVIVMLALPFLLPRFGVRKGMTLGLISWSLRFFIFALLPYRPLVLAALGLHGFCIVFFFVIAFMYVNEIAPTEVQASAQSLVSLFVFGAGRYAGSFLSGAVKDFFTHGPATAPITEWRLVFMVPAILTLLCAITFPLVFKDPDAKQSALAAI